MNMLYQVHGKLSDKLKQQRWAPPLYRLYRDLRHRTVTVSRRSPYENIYYCCTQKTASQWFRKILTDPIVYKYTGLAAFPYFQQGLRYAQAGDAQPEGFIHLDKPLPKRTIGIHLYIDYPTYLGVPKPAKHKTFFVLRDPRDTIVSWYFSAKYSHELREEADAVSRLTPQLRSALEERTLSAGLKLIIDKLEHWGSFWAQRSWMRVTEDQENIRVFRYEDLVRDERTFLNALFEYLDINVPEHKFSALYDRHRFEWYSGGRKRGAEEDQHAHYRKGVSGDWKNYFDDSTTAYFRKTTGDLLEVLDYRE